MLSFLNPLFLLSLPLAALPIIINLIRPRVKLQFDWPSLYLLRRAEKKRARRRIRIIEIILIALRVLIIASAVLLLARPYVSSGGRGQADTVIILDDSLSMGYVDAGESRLSRAKKAISAMLEATDDSDRVALITGSRPYDAEWETLPDIRGELAAAAPGSNNRLGLSLSSVFGLLDDAGNRKEIHIFTDCQRNSFAEWPVETGGDVRIMVHDIREEPGPFQNLAVTGYGVAVVSPETAVVRVSGFGDVTPARLEWEGGFASVGRGELDFAKVPLSSAGTAKITLADNSFTFDNTLELPRYYRGPLPYFISPEVRAPYFDAALWSLGAVASSGFPSSQPAVAVSRFGVIPEGAQRFAEEGGLLLLSVSPADSGEAWGLRIKPGKAKGDYDTLMFMAPLYDSVGIAGPSVGGLHDVEYDANWSVAAKTTGGEPTILFRKLGEGEVWVLLAPTGPGSGFPLHPSFVGFMGDIVGRAREITSGNPRHIDLASAESEVDFLSEAEFADEFPDVVYVKKEKETGKGWSFDLTLPVFIFLLLFLIAEPFLAAYVTRKTR